jgi:hypothetical protein
MAANTFSALTNPTPSATMGGMQQPQAAPTGPGTGTWSNPSGASPEFMKVLQMIQTQDPMLQFADPNVVQAVYQFVNNSPKTGGGGFGSFLSDTFRNTAPVAAMIGGGVLGSVAGPALGEFLGGAGELAGGAGGAGGAVGGYGAGAGTLEAANAVGAAGGDALGSFIGGNTANWGLDAATAGALGGAAGGLVAQAAPGAASDAGLSTAANASAQGLPAAAAPAALAAAKAGGAGEALNRIIAGTGTPGDYLTLGIPATGAIASLLAGANASNASSKAAQAQEQAAQAAIAEQRRQFDVTQANNAPFLATGTAANARLSQLLGTAPGYTGSDAGSLTKPFTSADLNADPVYNSGLQFGLDQGTKAINARAIAGGNYDSGATLKALTQFGNDYGSTKANDSFNRYQTQQGNTFNRLSGVSGTGQTAVGQVAQAGTNAANTVSGLLTDQGTARSAGIVGGSNAFTNAAGNINSLANNFSSNATLQALLAQRQPTYFANG